MENEKDTQFAMQTMKLDSRGNKRANKVARLFSRLFTIVIVHVASPVLCNQIGLGFSVSKPAVAGNHEKGDIDIAKLIGGDQPSDLARF